MRSTSIVESLLLGTREKIIIPEEVPLQQALAHQIPEIHHSDQGVQYAATTYTQMLQEANVQISMPRWGKPGRMATPRALYEPSFYNFAFYNIHSWKGS